MRRSTDVQPSTITRSLREDKDNRQHGIQSENHETNDGLS